MEMEELVERFNAELTSLKLSIASLQAQINEVQLAVEHWSPEQPNYAVEHWCPEQPNCPAPPCHCHPRE